MDNLHYKNLQSAIDCHEMLASIIRYLLDLRKNCVRVVCNIAGTDDQLRHNKKVVVVRHPPPPQQQLFRLNSMGSLSLNLDY